ncbi:MAG: hypothetical protein ACP5KV_04650 [Candidatus Methanomethylicaceae archaeon]
MSVLISSNCAPDPSKEIEEILESSGLSLINPAVKGKSGVVHVFNAVANDGDGTIFAVDVAHSNGPVDEIQLLRFYVKCIDTDPEKRILLCIPGANDAARRLAPVFGVTLVEGRDYFEALEGLRSVIKSRRV